MTQTSVIVGAGLAGLTAALRLQQAGKTGHVLEARNRVGGRAVTTTITVNGKQHQFDYRANFIGNDKAQQPIWDLVRELGLEVFEQYEGPENAAPPPFRAGKVAFADVVLDTDAIIWRIDAAHLRDVASCAPETGHAPEAAFFLTNCQRLAVSNQRLCAEAALP